MTSAVAIKAGDVLGDVYELKFNDRTIVAHRTPQRVDLYVPKAEVAFGSIRLGAPSGESGSVWIGRDCIGEFEIVESKFVVTPISGGRLQVDSRESVHPLDYLLNEAVKTHKV
jgi:hypothetical protein